MRQRLLADLSLLGITLIWGSTFVVVKEALQSVSTLLFLALRFSLAALALAFLFRRRLRPDKASLLSGVAAGTVLFLGYLLQTLGLRLTTPPKSAFLTALAVILVPIFSAILNKSWPAWNSLAGVVAAAVGLYLLVAPTGRWEPSRGDVLTLLCAAAFGLHILLVGRFSRAAGVAVLSVVQVAVAAVLSLATFFWAEEPYVRWTLPLVAAVFTTGLLATALAFSVQAWAQQFTSPTHTGLIFSMEPVFAWITSYIVASETIGGRGAWGALLILLGIVLSEARPS